MASIASVPRQGPVDLVLGKSSSTTLSFESFDLPSTNQRILGAPHPDNTVAPLALRPSSHSNDIKLDEVIQRIKSLQAQDGLLTKKLALHGTLLFRDLPIHDAEEFSRFAHSFGYKPHEIIGIVVDRPLLAPNVAPANESPKDVLIYNHNESPQVPHAPEYIFFFSQKAPLKGGETPISSSLELFRRAREEIPDFIDELAQKVILSKVTYKFDKQYAGGSTLRQAFGKDFSDDDDDEMKRKKITHQIARYGRGKHTTWEWVEDGVVLTHRLPAIRTQPETDLPTLFTGLAAYWKNKQGAVRSRKEVTRQLYGDGSPIPDKYLEHLAKITDEITVLHKWKQGDVFVYDNIIAQHGRHPWEGKQSDRVVLASLFDGHRIPGAYGDADWAQVVQALDG
ncbi:taurine catabolism dioxygenase TauD [Colletotrichum higginsianum]|uniref:Taurine catabolism dioxygenase TauD n=1 Tax=Colletotrichum higginsianum (strain IMI 349063) TaxID=759273 RepID=H1VAI4_COLHI|nr:Taurine catabolism dioxygenase TauD [Colletotrichum higginsianum IMI 349063]OBR11375.1 Taurine catabolism dioxygenase TauD [Colletotrichum higginsianum IMI 349063]CCF37237.1 taurine catabolism dioxygenase TauD [Colletotrichum higginsianum]